MPEHSNWVFENQPRAGKAHNFTHASAPGFFVTVNRAFGANRFFRQEQAILHTLVGIIKQRLAIRTKLAVGLMFGTAVDG